MTPAIKQLQQLQQNFDVLTYEVAEASTAGWGNDVVEKLALPIEQVFKTLVVEGNDGALLVALVPVSAKLNLKQMAKVCGKKKVSMATPQKVKASTGYVLGGVSPFGQKKPLTTVLDSSAMAFENIYVSAGKRGVELKINPATVMDCLTALSADITD